MEVSGSASRPCGLTPWEKPSFPTKHEDQWAPEPIWTDVNEENIHTYRESNDAPPEYKLSVLPVQQPAW
jgi:hypothetical protein